VRTWTHGWDVYCPNQNVSRHGYYNDAVQMDLGKFWALNAISHKRWRRLIGLNPTPLGKKYGLGTKRTMSDFVRFSGMDFVAHKATKEAHLGLVNNSYLSSPE
jgi:hypothetical protein